MPTEVDLTVNHYKFWSIERPVVTLKVDRRQWTTELDYVGFIGNPTVKEIQNRRTTKMVDDTLHLTAYRIAQSHPPRNPVSFSNQFGTATWQIGNSELLLVPALKAIDPGSPSEPPNRGTHYVCYPVKDHTVVRKVRLTDQFDRKSDRKGEIVTRLQPVYIALPAQKNDEGPQEPGIWLAIYRFTSQAPLTEAITANIFDQFGPRRVLAKQSCMLAVPSSPSYP